MLLGVAAVLVAFLAVEGYALFRLNQRAPGSRRVPIAAGMFVLTALVTAFAAWWLYSAGVSHPSGGEAALSMGLAGLAGSVVAGFLQLLLGGWLFAWSRAKPEA